MFSSLIITLTFVIFGNCAFVRVWDAKGAPEDIFVENGEVNEETVPEGTVGLFVDKYSGGDTQITKISDLPNLKNIWMYANGQEFLVVLENLPNIIEADVSRNELSYVSKTMFSNVQVRSLWLNGNKIRTIENGAFGKNITSVSLYCNLLKMFKPEWFQNPSIVTWLELHGNKITHIKENAFKSFPNLKGINLVMNEIYSIGDGAFSGRNIYDEIYLAYNQLTELKPSIFTGRVRINNFDIRYNNLTFLSTEFLNNTSIGSIHLIDGNPWDCACYLNHITKWVRWDKYGQNVHHPKDRAGQPRCVSKKDDKYKCNEIVEEDLIYYYMDHSTPPINERGKYCSCRSSLKSWADCYHLNETTI